MVVFDFTGRSRSLGEDTVRTSSKRVRLELDVKSLEKVTSAADTEYFSREEYVCMSVQEMPVWLSR